MKRKTKESKLNVVLTAMLVVFVCLLSFSIGVISGKGWSDRDYKVKHIEQDSHLKLAKEDDSTIGEEMSEKEVELLTQKALEDAKAQAPSAIGPSDSAKTKSATDNSVGAKKSSGKMPATADSDEADESEEAPLPKTKNAPVKEAAVTPSAQPASKAAPEKADKKAPASTESKVDVQTEGKGDRGVSSLPPAPTTPAPASIEYTVQVAAYKTMGEAESHSQKLIDKGFPAFPVKATIDGGDWYRVSIGSFKNRTQAMKYEEALKKQSFVKSTFVQKISRTKQ